MIKTLYTNIHKSWRDLIRGENPKFILWTFPFLMTTIYFVAPYLLTLPNPFGINFAESGQIGDTIGGISNPLISIFAAFLTFLAFWVQFQSNKKQTIQFANQDKFQKIERFENKFYQLLAIHKNNVNELQLDNKTEGKKVFEEILIELELSFEILRVLDNSNWQNKTLISNSDRINIAYITFYVGIQDNSNLLNSLLS